MCKRGERRAPGVSLAMRVSSEGAGPASMAAGKTETTNEAGGMAKRGERCRGAGRRVCTAVLSEAWAKLRAEPLILPRDVHDSLLEVGQRENNKR